MGPVGRIDRLGALTGDGTYGNVIPLRGGGAIATMNSIMAPDDIYRIDGPGKVTQVTAVNRDLLAQLDPVTLTKFSFAGAHND